MKGVDEACADYDSYMNTLKPTPNHPEHPKRQRGFTLIELMVEALKLYRLDNQNYPTAEQGLNALVVKPTVGPAPLNWKPYIDKLPNDPWGRPYQYMNPGVKGEVDVLSLGADGQAGGEGKNADIGSWQ